MWGKGFRNFASIFVRSSERAESLTVRGFHSLRFFAIPTGHQESEKATESTPYPTPRVLTLWGNGFRNFMLFLYQDCKGLKALRLEGFTPYDSIAIPAGHQESEKATESTPYPTPPTPYALHPNLIPTPLEAAIAESGLALVLPDAKQKGDRPFGLWLINVLTLLTRATIALRWWPIPNLKFLEP